MASYPEQVVGARLEVGPDGSQAWTLPRRGTIAIGECDLSFESWKIPFSAIRNAVLNREGNLLGVPHYSLLIETESGSYLFQLGGSEHWEQLPFPFQKTTGTSFDLSPLVRRLLLIMALGLLVLVLDLLI